jgi:hypothetical protein
MTTLDIEPIKKCLHEKKCKHLDSVAGQRPMCSYCGDPIFDLDECPRGLWWVAGRQKCLSLINVNREDDA